MKITLVANEFFSWNQHGGYGAFTKKLSTELVKKGVEVEVLVQKIMPDQKPVGEFEIIDGAKVFTLPKSSINKLDSKMYLRNTDMIHSECGMLDTYLAFIRNNVPTILSLQDLRTKKDLKLIGEAEPKTFIERCWRKYVHQLYAKAMKMADVVAPQANILTPKIKEIFGLNINKLNHFQLLPNFVDEPKQNIVKDSKPNILFLGRLDKIKNPELCFKVAKAFPTIDFHILGHSHDPIRDLTLRKEWNKISNLHLLGFDENKVKEECLSKAWILINTSIYEALPVSFLEAMAHKCAILSTQNPDDYTEMFGCYENEQTVDSLVKGLKFLIKNDRWKEYGEKGFNHFKKYHTTEKGIEQHLNLYKELIDK